MLAVPGLNCYGCELLLQESQDVLGKKLQTRLCQ
jgi:hypothetical protein